MLAVDLVALLLVLMGGRSRPGGHRRCAAVGGDSGYRSRVQAGLERATLAGLMIVIVFGSAVAVGRRRGGRPRCRRSHRAPPRALADGRDPDQPELWTLHLGYAWLALGLLAKGIGS